MPSRLPPPFPESCSHPSKPPRQIQPAERARTGPGRSDHPRKGGRHPGTPSVFPVPGRFLEEPGDIKSGLREQNTRRECMHVPAGGLHLCRAIGTAPGSGGSDSGSGSNYDRSAPVIQQFGRRVKRSSSRHRAPGQFITAAVRYHRRRCAAQCGMRTSGNSTARVPTSGFGGKAHDFTPRVYRDGV